MSWNEGVLKAGRPAVQSREPRAWRIAEGSRSLRPASEGFCSHQGNRRSEECLVPGGVERIQGVQPCSRWVSGFERGSHLFGHLSSGIAPARRVKGRGWALRVLCSSSGGASLRAPPLPCLCSSYRALSTPTPGSRLLPEGFPASATFLTMPRAAR